MSAAPTRNSPPTPIASPEVMLSTPTLAVFLFNLAYAAAGICNDMSTDCGNW